MVTSVPWHLRPSLGWGGNQRTVAPQVLSKQPQDDKVDMWALGCILYEMATFSHAFSSTSAIQRGEFAPLPPDLPPELAQTITCLLQPNPLDRPSVAELLNLPAVRCRLGEWPYPVVLDTPSHSPTRLAPLSRAVLEARPASAGAAAATATAATAAEAEAVAATAAAAAAVAGFGTPVPCGTLVWSKHGSDGLQPRMLKLVVLAAAGPAHHTPRGG